MGIDKQSYIDTVSKLEKTCRQLISEGWRLRIKKKHNTLYITARKSINGKRVEKYIAKVSRDEISSLIEKGVVISIPKNIFNSGEKICPKISTMGRNGEKQSIKRSIWGESGEKSINRESQLKSGEKSGEKIWDRTWKNMDVSILFEKLRVHRIALRYLGKDVSPLLLNRLKHEAVEFKYVNVSKQWIIKLMFGYKRWITLQVNRDGSCQVFVEASSNPLTITELLGFIDMYLIHIFITITGKVVSLDKFVLMSAPEFNIDVPGLNLVEGIGVNGKSITLTKFREDIIRMYVVGAGEKETMPNGGTRIEARLDSVYSGMNLKEFFHGVESLALFPRMRFDIEEIKRIVDEVRGYVSRQQLTSEALAESVATKLGNILYVLFDKFQTHIENGVVRGFEKLGEHLNSLFEKINLLEEENKRLKNMIEQLRKEQEEGFTFANLPHDLKSLLYEMEKDGYIRIFYDRIEYGDKVWGAIRRLHGNIDGWILRESDNYYSRKAEFIAVLKTIRYYDNKYNGEQGVPWRIFYQTYKEFLKIYM